jgi:hypothetical protein
VVSLLAAVPAYAGSLKHVKPAVIQSNWYWAKSTDPLQSVTIGTPLEGVSEPSGVPSGDLAVAWVDTSSTEPNKETYLAFDQNALTSVSKVSSFKLTVFLDSASPQVQTTPPLLIACLPQRLWNNGDGDDVANKPTDDCSNAAKGRYDTKAKSYSFTITKYAQAWVDDVNTGVAIRQSPDQTTPFQLTFKDGKAVRAAMAFVPVVVQRGPVSQPPAPQSPQQPAPPVSQPVGSTGSGGLTGGLGAGSVAPPSTPVQPVQPAQVAPPSTVTQASIRHVAAASNMPGTGFWLAAAGLLVLLVVIYVVVADNGGRPVAAVRRPSRLDKVLRQRRTSTLTSLTSSPATRSVR